MEENKPMPDRYLNSTESIKRLVADYNKHKSLFIAFDFDNTVFDYFRIGDTYPEVIRLLNFCKRKGMKLILFTAMEADSVNLFNAIEYCKFHGFAPDYVNENPIMKTRKPYYNILLDDRAGLGEAYYILYTTLIHVDMDINLQENFQ